MVVDNLMASSKVSFFSVLVENKRTMEPKHVCKYAGCLLNNKYYVQVPFKRK